MKEWQSRKARAWLRITAFLTALIFVTHDIVWADGGGMINSLASRNKVEVEVPGGIDWAHRNLLNAVSLPESIGQIKRNFQGGRDRIVIHVQDAHANAE